MVRIRAIPADDDAGLRSRRTRSASSVENMDSTTAGQVMNDGKRALYHCNYCNKDISGKIRIKCAVCTDFDLCVECFSVGAEVHPHKNNHPYRVMDNLSFPLFCPDWNADEEMLLLEGLEMYGLSNWAEVAEHVGTKSKSECVDHYNEIYMNSPCFPLPDMSRVAGKTKEELIAMAKEQSDLKKAGEGTSKEHATFPANVKVEELPKDASVARPSEVGSKTTFAKDSNAADLKSDGDGSEVEADRSIGGKKPRISGDDGTSLLELSGYNPKRQEFDVEYDNDAEQLLADMEFKETDTEDERELKLRVLRIYWKRIEERQRRKDFILERNLLYEDPFEKDLSPEEKELCHRYRPFMRFSTKEEHQDLLRTVVEEHRILKRLQSLKEARAAGCRTSAEAERFISMKRKREAEEHAQRAKENSEAGSSSKVTRTINVKKEVYDSPRGSYSGGNCSSSTAASRTFPNSLDEWDITGFPGANLLSQSEIRLCKETRMLPSHYLNMLQTLSVEVMKGKLTKKSDAYALFKVDPAKVDRVYEMLVKKGLAPP